MPFLIIWDILPNQCPCVRNRRLCSVARDLRWGESVAKSAASEALQHMASRFAVGRGELGTAVRELQEIAVLRRDQEERRGSGNEGQLRTIADTEGQLAARLAKLLQTRPDFMQLISPEPLKADEVEGLLGSDEALTFFLTGQKESYVFAVTNTRFEWRTIPLGEEELFSKVKAFRLDASKPEPMDIGAARELYSALFSRVEPVIEGKRHLLVVPSGPLASLSFHLLVTQDPDATTSGKSSRYRDAAWLVNRYAISVLPSVASLKALRQRANKGVASKSYVAFGNPLLLGPDRTDTSAWDGQRCPTEEPGLAQRVAARDAAQFPDIGSLFRGNLADVSEVQRLSALPETTGELCAVARKLGVPESEIWLGERATERNIKRMSRQGQLADYGIVHFATHGLVAGELKGLAEIGAGVDASG